MPSPSVLNAANTVQRANVLLDASAIVSANQLVSASLVAPFITLDFFDAGTGETAIGLSDLPTAITYILYADGVQQSTGPYPAFGNPLNFNQPLGRTVVYKVKATYTAGTSDFSNSLQVTT